MPSDIERKLALLDLLSSRQGKTVEEIFEKLPSFFSTEGRQRGSAKKMFERDKEDLAAMGFPLLPEADDEGVETYRLDPPNPALPSDFVLTPEETKTLRAVLGDSVLRSQLPEPSFRTLLKLDELYSAFYAADGVEKAASLLNAALLSKVLSAIHRSKALDVDYPDHGGAMERRVFSPWRLIVKRGCPHLLAWCHRDCIPKMLVLNRMGRVAVSREMWKEEPDGFDIRRYVLTQDYLPDGSKNWHVRVRVGSTEAWRLEETARDAIISRNKDGSCDAQFGVSNREQFFRYVLTFGRHAKILSPEEARESFARFLEGGTP
jgi:predicted DNA-binding transcriptional regulator YafY